MSLAGKGGEKIEKYHKITITTEEISGLDTVSPQIPIVIEAAPEVAFGKINEVLHILQEKGISKINIQ